MSTTAYLMDGKNFIVGIEFLDENTVIAGHCRGILIIATLGMSSEPHQLIFDHLQSPSREHIPDHGSFTLLSFFYLS